MIVLLLQLLVYFMVLVVLGLGIINLVDHYDQWMYQREQDKLNHK